MKSIEKQLLEEIQRVMREKGVSQTDYAAHRKATRQSVNPYFTGRKLLLSPIGSDLLEYLGVRIKLEVVKD